MAEHQTHHLPDAEQMLRVMPRARVLTLITIATEPRARVLNLITVATEPPLQNNMLHVPGVDWDTSSVVSLDAEFLQPKVVGERTSANTDQQNVGLKGVILKRCLLEY